MSFIDSAQIEELKAAYSKDKASLGKLYKAKKNPYDEKSVEHNLVEGMKRDGWEEFGSPLKTRTKLRMLKSHDVKFEDDIWCQLYELGYSCLNINKSFRLNYGKSPLDKKQIDVFAVNDDSILLIECKSSKKLSKPPSFKTEFETLSQKLSGYAKTLEQLFGRGRKIKYIFATRNLKLEADSSDIQRLESTGSFFYNDDTYEYINSLIKAYKKVAHYQFMALLFKGKEINKERIQVPALEGFMGNKKYYMFSIEPQLLLKVGFILHRTRANKTELPTYQRLLVPSRLKGISKFIDEGGFFPNSIIMNFGESKALQFEGSHKSDTTRSRSGTLKIPNAYAIAYIIDGQHRLYGYAQSEYKKSNTIPVVAFSGLESAEQLKIFMDINQNQKAVSATLRLTLEQDIYWNADRADTRMKALRSAIIDELSTSKNSPLYNIIDLGEDKAKLRAKPFGTALLNSGLLPKVRGNIYDEGSEASLYNTNNQDNNKAMLAAKRDVVKFLSKSYELVKESYPDVWEHDSSLIISPRGTYAFICLLGSLNSFEYSNGNVNALTSPEERFICIKKYLDYLLSKLEILPNEETEILFGKLGGGADNYWLRFFQNLIAEEYAEFKPEGLSNWIEKQDSTLQATGRDYGIEIEKFIKKNVMKQLQTLFGEDWEDEITEIKIDCISRALKQKQQRRKAEGVKEEADWTEMFFINDYKWIIEKFWTTSPQNPQPDFKNFEKIFSVDIEKGFNSKSEKLKWLSYLNSYRNLWAHEGSKSKRLDKNEVMLLQKIHEKLV